MRITVIGTSNSVMIGNYVDALTNSGHKVINLSIGKVSICHHLATFLRKGELISKSECIILDFSPNLSNWIEKDGASLFKHVYNFYALISSLNIPIININFPSTNQKRPGASEKIARFIRILDKKFGFISLDLMQYDIPESHWKDKNHLKAYVSYGIGQIIGYLLNTIPLAVPSGGNLISHPYSILDTEELSDGKFEVMIYRSRRVIEKYIVLSNKFNFDNIHINGKRLIAIGTYIPKDTESGIRINNKFVSSLQVKIHSGSLLSEHIIAKNDKFEIIPLKGINKLPFYGSKKKDTINCSGTIGISYILLYNESHGKVQVQSANNRENSIFENTLTTNIKKLFTPLETGKTKGRLIEKGASYSTLPFVSHSAGIRISGTGNMLWISPKSDISKMKIHIVGNNNIIIIDDDCKLAGKIVINSHRGMIHIEKGTVSIDLYLLCATDKKIHIGKHCLISRLVEIRATDAHSLIDLDTFHRVNENGDISIGNHVWIGLRSIINKNVTIADDVIVGCNSFVNKDVTESHVAVAGIPASIIKRNVSWNRQQKDTFTEREIFFGKEDA